jgi:hypothetical protein
MKNLIFLLTITITACRPLPKVSSFVEASSKMREGVNAGFVAVDQSLAANELLSVTTTDRKTSGILNNTLKDLKENGKDLQKLSSMMDKSLLGISAYARSLNNLVETGNSGEKNALQASKALTDVANLIAPPQISAAIGITQEGIAKIYGQIARVQAANSLKKIMEEASPTVMTYDTIFSKIIDQLSKYNQAVYQAKKQLLFTPFSLNTSLTDYEKELDSEYITLFRELTLISNYKNTKDADVLVNLKKMDAFITDEKSLEARQNDLIIQTKNIEIEKSRILPVTAKLRVTEKKYLDESIIINQLFKKSKDAIHAWANAHTDIQAQLDKKQLPNFQELNDILGDLKEIREKLKALNP